MKIFFRKLLKWDLTGMPLLILFATEFKMRVTYNLMLDNRFRVYTGYLGAEFQETLEFGSNNMNSSENVASPVGHHASVAVDYQQFGGRQFPIERKWALGLQATLDSGNCDRICVLMHFLTGLLEDIVGTLKDRKELSYLFQMPVSKKEAPDYFDIIEHPMDLSKMRDKVRRLEYKSREEFRHDMYQIAYNAHWYNNRQNPCIPPLADQLLELCDHLLDVKAAELTEAEAGIEYVDN